MSSAYTVKYTAPVVASLVASGSRRRLDTATHTSAISGVAREKVAMPPPPAVSSVKFDSTGSKIVVTYAARIDSGYDFKLHSSAFSCEKVISFPNTFSSASFSSCRFSDDHRLVITLPSAYTRTVVSVGDTLLTLV